MTRSSRKKAVQPPHKYRLRFVPPALEEWQHLDGPVKEPLRKLLRKRLDNPRVPGSALHGPLHGCYKIKLGKQGYRLVYTVEDDALVVLVLAVEKRENALVYRSALDRVRAGLAALVEGLTPKT